MKEREKKEKDWGKRREKESLRTVAGEGGKVVSVLFEGVDVEGRGIVAGLFETVVMVLGSGGRVEANVAATVVVADISTIDWMDEERADMIDSDSGGMVDRTTGMEVIFGVPTGVKVAVMVMGIDVVATIAELGREEVEMLVSEVETNVVVFVMIALMVLLLGGGVMLIGASKRIEGTGSVVSEDTVSAIVAVVVGFAAAKAVMDAGSLTPAIAQS